MKQAVDFLYDIPQFTKKHSLAHTVRLMELLGNPGDGCRVIHVAGSNGKGSVCCFLSHMLLSGGKTVGLFTSPHLVDVRERFQINGALCGEAAFLAAFSRVRTAAEQMEAEGAGYPTFFEFIYAMGMLLFEEAGVEYVILETGLGGRLDATNSYSHPVLSVITSISLEHTEYLGDTIEAIAGEKAGIIKPGIPVVFDANDPASARVIREKAKEMKSLFAALMENMYEIRGFKNNFIDFSFCPDYDKKTEWTIPAAAAYQAENAALALLAMRMLSKRFPGEVPGEESLRRGMREAVWPGRMQEIAPEIYFDGAHNPSGIEKFAEAAKRLSEKDGYPPLLLFSMVKEKDYSTSVELLTKNVRWDAMAVTTIPNERGISFDTLQKLFEADTDRPVSGYADYREALAAMVRKKKPGQKLFCTGSLYFIGALLEAWKEDAQ